MDEVDPCGFQGSLQEYLLQHFRDRLLLLTFDLVDGRDSFSRVFPEYVGRHFVELDELIEQTRTRLPQAEWTEFLVCLFLVMLADQTVHKHFRPSHPAWLEITRTPLLGWRGTGPHVENPVQIIVRASGLVDARCLAKRLTEAADVLADRLKSYVLPRVPALVPSLVVDAILKDRHVGDALIDPFLTRLAVLRRTLVP